MKHKKNILLWLLIITSLLVAILGGYIKYFVLKPLGLEPEASIMEIPFLLTADEGLRFSLRYAMEKKDAPPETAPAETAPAQTAPPATEAPVTETAPAETAPPETLPPQTEPVIVKVEESWFDDVLFIGDSRTIGLQRHARLGQADYFCGIGMSYFNMFTFYCRDDNFRDTTLENLLKTKTYGKIYIALGVNGSGNPPEMIDAVLDETIAKIQELQPDAKIILHATIGVGPRKEQKAWYFSNEILYAVNEIYASKADGETIFYIDPNDWMTYDDGHLSDEYGDQDQCHLTTYGYEAWGAWILDSAGDLGIP